MAHCIHCFAMKLLGKRQRSTVSWKTLSSCLKITNQNNTKTSLSTWKKSLRKTKMSLLNRKMAHRTIMTKINSSPKNTDKKLKNILRSTSMASREKSFSWSSMSYSGLSPWPRETWSRIKSAKLWREKTSWWITVSMRDSQSILLFSTTNCEGTFPTITQFTPTKVPTEF